MRILVPVQHVRSAEPRDAKQVQRLYVAMMREMAAGGDDALADSRAVDDILSRRIARAFQDGDRLLLVANDGDRAAGLGGMLEAELGVLEGNPARRLYEQLGFATFRRQMRLRL